MLLYFIFYYLAFGKKLSSGLKDVFTAIDVFYFLTLVLLH